MDKDFQTSFIPKKSLSEERSSGRRPVSILVFLATLIFLASLASIIGVYFYRASLERQVESMKDQLEKARARFEPSLISDLETLDRRLTASEQVLSEHIVVLPIFDALEALTLKTIRYTSFEYVLGAERGEPIKVTMKGQSASGYTPIALQSDMFLRNKYIKDPLFSDLNVDAAGKVNFNLTFTIDPTYLSYEESLAREAAISDEPSTNEETSLVEEEIPALPEEL